MTPDTESPTPTLNSMQLLWVMELFRNGTTRIPAPQDYPVDGGINPQCAGALRRKGLIHVDRQYAIPTAKCVGIGFDLEREQDARIAEAAGLNWGP